jgi:two-component system, OmpR family, response regulator RegX3
VHTVPRTSPDLVKHLRDIVNLCYARAASGQRHRQVMRIALLEDDAHQSAAISRWLTDAGHVCHVYRKGADLVRDSGRESFDLFILDWELPDISGIQVLRWMRERSETLVPVLFVTARTGEEDIVKALEEGADDYMIKPVRQTELLARVNALWRRTRSNTAVAPVLEFPPYRLDTLERQITLDGAAVDMTQKEFELALFLFRNVGRLLSRGHIFEAVWGRNAALSSRTTDTHLSRVRTKLKLQPEHGFRLVSVYNYGYRLEEVRRAAS